MALHWDVCCEKCPNELKTETDFTRAVEHLHECYVAGPDYGRKCRVFGPRYCHQQEEDLVIQFLGAIASGAISEPGALKRIAQLLVDLSQMPYEKYYA